MSSKKIIITGTSGFLGKNLLRYLINNSEYTIYALSSQQKDLKEQFAGADVTLLNKDEIRGTNASEMFSDSFVVNCAFPRNTTGEYIADGLDYTRTVFESAADYNAAGIINISSQSVYSQQRTCMATEETPLCLETSYAVGKYAVELMLKSICRGKRTKYTNLRMASLIGPGFDQRIVNRFIIKMMNREPVTVVLQDKQLGFLDVKDAVRAIRSVLDYPVNLWKPVYNVGNGIGYTVKQIYDAAAGVLKKTINVQDPVIETGSDASTTSVSFELLHKDTGFVPETGLIESIERIIAHM